MSISKGKPFRAVKPKASGVSNWCWSSNSFSFCKSSTSVIRATLKYLFFADASSKAPKGVEPVTSGL